MLHIICTTKHSILKMYNKSKNVLSLNLYVQHLGVSPQGLEDVCERKPASPHTIVQPSLDPHVSGCCLCFPLTDSAIKRPQVVGTLAEPDV